MFKVQRFVCGSEDVSQYTTITQCTTILKRKNTR